MHHVGLDTNILIYYIEASKQFGEQARELIGHIEKGDLNAQCSELVRLELLSSPKLDTRQKQNKVLRMVEESRLDLSPISSEVLLRAADLRRHHKSLRSPDAIHVATALIQGCDFFITNDNTLEKLDTELTVTNLTNFIESLYA
jgi:predicted nucleic acid-binding protein